MRSETRAARTRFGVAALSMAVSMAMSAPAQVVLTADGMTDAYTRVDSALGSEPETPDCSHPEFGPHITQATDDALKKYVFVFHIHVTPDNDRCENFDRQRLEIKTMGDAGTPDYLKGFLNDSVTFRWKFQLPAGFQPSTSFTHIHQIKAYDGDAGSPILTLTPRLAGPNVLELIHVDSRGVTRTLATTPLDPFAGTWVEAYEKITYSSNGQYAITIKRLSDGATLFAYANDNLDLWRTGTTVVRPKWGIYRSLNHPEQLRDEEVLFDRFCLAKGSDDCVSEEELPAFSLTGLTLKDSARTGGTALYAVKIDSLRGFGADVSLHAVGLPPETKAYFRPQSIKGEGAAAVWITTASGTPAGTYRVVIDAVSGSLTHTVTERLRVRDGSNGQEQ